MTVERTSCQADRGLNYKSAQGLAEIYEPKFDRANLACYSDQTTRYESKKKET